MKQKEERRSKDARILGLIPDFKNGFIYLNRGLTNQLVQEFKEYPYGTTRDLMDALAMYRQVLSRPLTSGELVAIEERREQVNHQGLDTVNWGA